MQQKKETMVFMFRVLNWSITMAFLEQPSFIVQIVSMKLGSKDEEYQPKPITKYCFELMRPF